MIKLDGIVRSVDRLTDAMNNLASAINRAAGLIEVSRQPQLPAPVVGVVPPPDNSGAGGFGQGW